MTQAERGTRKVIIWLISTNIVIRLIWLIFVQPKQIADFSWYFTHAAQMAQGQGYMWGGHYTAYWPIGWPFILSLVFRLTGAHVLAGLILNALFSIGIVLLVYAATLKLFVSQRIATVSAFAYTLLPSQIEWNAILGSEESFTFLLVLSLYLYLGDIGISNRKWVLRFALAGVTMGLATDVRPVTLLFPVFILVYELILQRPMWSFAVARATVFTVSMMLAILPVTIRNYLTMHHFVIVSTNGGVNLWQGIMTNGGYYWSWSPSVNPLLQAKGNEILENQIGLQVALQHIFQHPLLTLGNGFIKIFDLYKNDVNGVWFTIQVVNPSHVVLLIANQISTGAYWFLMVFSLIGLALYFRTSFSAWFKLGLPIVFLLYYTALFLFFPAWDRFRYPLMPIFSFFFGRGFVLIWDWVNEIFAQRRRLIP